MNSLVGKSTGIALLMAAALIAALFAMGVFSATGVGAHGTDDTDHGTGEGQHEHPPATLDTITFSVPSSIQDGEQFVGTEPTVIVAEDYMYNVTVNNDITVLTVAVQGDSGVDASIESPDDDFTEDDPDTTGNEEIAGHQVRLAGEYSTTITVNTTESSPTDPLTDASMEDRTYTFVLNYERVTDKTTPGSSQSLDVEFSANNGENDNIIVKLAKFGVPSSIDADDVTVNLEGAAAAGDSRGNPSDVEVDGTTITLVGPILDNDDDPIAAQTDNAFTGATINFKRSAGITLPIYQDDYDIEVTNDEDADDSVQNWVTVRREVTVKPASGKRGTEITITAKGYSDNTHDITIGSGDNSLTKSADAVDGAFTLTVDTSVKNNEGKTVFKGPAGELTTVAVGDASDTFEIKASFSWSPESPTPGQDITVTLADIDPENENLATSDDFDADDDEPPTITISGEDVENVDDAGDDKRSTWKGQVNGDTPLGNRRIAVSVGETDLPAQNITVGTNDLTVDPSTVVPRQEISIDGSGFSTATDKNFVPKSTENSDGDTTDSHVKVGGVPAQNARHLVNGNGNISFNVRVPDGANPGTRTVEVRDEGGRVGKATITIAEPEITLNPAESLVGSEITVSGTGYPANDLVLINYDSNTVDTASTSSTGTFEQIITVPSGNDPGSTLEVEAVAQVQRVPASEKSSATADHKLPDAVITLSPSEVVAGGSLTITGTNYNGFRQISQIEVGGQTVTPVPAPSTDKWGGFSATVQVPQLTPGRYAVSARVGEDPGVSATEFIQVVTETVVVSTDPAEVFADLIGDGSLSRVWYLDPQSQTWSFYDPDPAFAAFNELNAVKSEETYILIITAEDTFGTKTLYPGTQFVTIP